MSWPQIVLVAWLSLGILVNISQTGKPCRPLEPGAVAVATVISAVLIWLVVIA